MKVLIVGGVAGGASCAARLRRLNEKAEIKIFERTGFVSYANCGLPYYIGDVITDEEDLTLQTPQSLKKRFNIDVCVMSEVMHINAKEKYVLVKNLKTGEEYKESYDTLVLSPGACPITPEISGGKDKVFTLRTVEDTLKIKNHIGKNTVRSALVLGGGFIGIEMAENLKNLGIDTSIAQGSGHMLSSFDADMASFVHAALRKEDINLYFDFIAEKIQEKNGKVVAVSTNGETLSADIIICAIGVLPENTLAKQAGLALGKKGGIITDKHMQTTVRDIYACGDAVTVKNGITKDEDVIPLAGPANKQGRIIADNICGMKSTYEETIGASIIKVGDRAAACVGINEKAAKQKGIDYGKIILSPSSHASYYPNAEIMTVKMLYHKNSFDILGVMIAGGDGVDKRADVFAAAIKAGMKAYDLKDLELCYAPPYSSAKDPVNMAGFIADNIKRGVIKQFYSEDIDTAGEDVFLLDTRTKGEYAKGHAEGFTNIPVDELRERLSELPKDKKIYVMCQSGLRSYIAARILIGNGFDAYNFAGGYRFYSCTMGDEKMKKHASPCGKEN